MLSKNLLVFPTNRAIREYITSKKSSNQILPKLLTIGELFGRVIIPPSNKTILDKDLRVLYLQLAIKKLEINKLGISKNFSKLYSQSDFIFKFFNELNSEFKTIDDLYKLDTYQFYEEHLTLLKEIYQKYITILDEKNLIDNISLPFNFTLNSNFVKEYPNITLYYEGYFSTFEFFIIRQIAKFSTLHLHCTINKFNEKNIELFRTIGITLEINYHYILDISSNTVISKVSLSENAISHTIYPVSGRLLQIAMIKYSISEMLQKGIEPSKIVLILPDENFSQFIKYFDNEKYFNFAMGNNISDSITYQTTHSINDYLNIDEPKYKQKIGYLNIDTVYLDEKIKPHWNKTIQKELFFELLHFITKDEKNTEIQEKLYEIQLGLENLLFNTLCVDTITLKDGFKIFLTKINSITTDDIKSGKITVMGILETRAIQYDGVVVVDFNDNLVPKRSVKDKFISSNVKKHSHLPTSKDRENLQKYYYQKLFSNSKEVYISYVIDKEHTASRFINELFEKPNIKELNFTNIIKSFKEIPSYEKNIIQEINLSKLEWSATSLKTFLECKRKYYLQNILKIPEHSISLKPQNYELGNIIHNILEHNYKNGKFSYLEIVDEISKYQNINPYLTIELELWKKKLKKFCMHEQKRFESGIKIHQLEKSFRIEINGIILKGKIDRIDKLKDGSFALLDYKTSSNLKIDTFKTYEHSTDFQLEFYFLATKDLGISQIGYYDLNSGEIKEEITLEEKLQKLFEILNSFQTQFVNFEMCDKEQICTFCPYKIICNKE